MKKGYKEQLNNFINYILMTYKADNKVIEFSQIFSKQQKKRELHRQVVEKKTNTRVISEKTADLCVGLVDCELAKGKSIGCYTKDYIADLENAKLELGGKFLSSILRRINNVK